VVAVAIVMGAQAVGAARLANGTHWEVSQGKAAIFGAALCMPLGAFGDLRIARKWKAWLCVAVLLGTVLGIGAGTWITIRCVRHPWPFWLGLAAAGALQITCKAGTSLITWAHRLPTDLELRVGAGSRQHSVWLSLHACSCKPVMPFRCSDLAKCCMPQLGYRSTYVRYESRLRSCP
jgi:hypothetical protein